VKKQLPSMKLLGEAAPTNPLLLFFSGSALGIPVPPSDGAAAPPADFRVSGAATADFPAAFPAVPALPLRVAGAPFLDCAAALR
jgi:hypothetical protein